MDSGCSERGVPPVQTPQARHAPPKSGMPGPHDGSRLGAVRAPSSIPWLIVIPMMFLLAMAGAGLAAWLLPTDAPAPPAPRARKGTPVTSAAPPADAPSSRKTPVTAGEADAVVTPGEAPEDLEDAERASDAPPGAGSGATHDGRSARHSQASRAGSHPTPSEGTRSQGAQAARTASGGAETAGATPDDARHAPVALGALRGSQPTVTALHIPPARIVGQVEAGPANRGIRAARPQIARCQRDRAQIVYVQLLMAPQGRIAIAQPDPTRDPGDQGVARCVANAIKSTGPFETTQSGIVFVTVELPSR